MSKKNGPRRGSPSGGAGIGDVVPWSVPVSLEEIPDGGLQRVVEAPDSARQAIAALAGLREILTLSATFDLTKRGGKVHVTGRLRAVVGQTCVVSLEPLESRIDEAIDLTFAPSGAAGPYAQISAADGRRETDDEIPEPLLGNSIDLGALAAEFLVLAIDPYPRKEGAEFAPPAAGETGNKPFAALAALRNEPGKRNN